MGSCEIWAQIWEKGKIKNFKNRLILAHLALEIRVCFFPDTPALLHSAHRDLHRGKLAAKMRAHGGQHKPGHLSVLRPCSCRQGWAPLTRGSPPREFPSQGPPGALPTAPVVDERQRALGTGWPASRGLPAPDRCLN